MPLYDFRCTACAQVHEELREVSNRDEDSFCPECSNTAERMLSAPAGINGNSADGYRHKTGKGSCWQSDMGPQGSVGKEWYGDNPHASSTLASK